MSKMSDRKVKTVTLFAPGLAGAAAAATPCVALRIWRSAKPDAYDDAMLVALKETLAGVDMAGEPTWIRAAALDAAAAIGLAVRFVTADPEDVRRDLAMTALALCAAGGDAAACLVISNIIRRLPQAGAAEARIATAWLVRAFRKASSRGPPLAASP